MKPNLSKTTLPKKQVSKVPICTSPKNQVEKMKLHNPKTTSPKKHVETLLENNIVIPQQDFTSLKKMKRLMSSFYLSKNSCRILKIKNKFLCQKMMMCY